MFGQTVEDKVDALTKMVQEMHDQELQCHVGMSWRGIIQEVLISTLWGSVIGYFLFRVMDYHFGASHYAPPRKRRRRGSK
jgi:hypothetical protein